jgi:predicted component of type VI protein secretion system
MLQQGLLERLDSLRLGQHHYPYGVIEAEVSRDALETGKLRFAKLRVVLRSGLEVLAPEACDLAALPLIEELGRSSSRAELTIYLGVPDYLPDRANSFKMDAEPDLRAKYRYIPCYEMRMDENTGDSKESVMVRKLNGRLLFEHEDRSGLECLPLVRVRRAGAGSGTAFRVEVATGFVPPCLFVPPPVEYRSDDTSTKGTDRTLSLPGFLAEIIRLAVQRIEVTRQRLARKLQNQGLDMSALQGVQFRHWTQLLLLSRHASRLLALQQSGRTTPFEMFLALREALAELEALNPGRQPAAGAAVDHRIDYVHDDPGPVFDRLYSRIEVALQDLEGVEFRMAEFQPADPQRPEVVRAVLGAEFFEANVTAWYLTIQTGLSVGDLVKVVQGRGSFELTIPERVGQAYGGLPLRHQPNPPPGLPDLPDLHYFQIEQSGDSFYQLLWGKVRQVGELAISRSSAQLNLENATFKIYAILRKPDA